jgi:hypothetical protein
MAKPNANKPPTTNPFMPSYDAPKLEGFKDFSGELAGYWDPEMTFIQFIPEEVNLFDNKIDDRKVSAIIIGTLTRDMPLAGKEEGEIVEGKTGDRVGVWYSPGMKGIVDLGGQETLMYPNGVKNTGKPNDMKVYAVQARRRGGRLEVTNDYRSEKTKLVSTPFDPKGAQKPPRAVAAPTADDFEPFEAY